MTADSAGSIEMQIGDWIREHVVIADGGRGRCRRLVLRHSNLEGHPQGDVTSIPIPNDEGLAGEVDMIINKLVDAAQRDANDFGGTIQKYILFAYYADDPNYVPRKMFRVAANDEITRDTSPSEPPTEKGLVSQTMRHLEAVMKTATMGQSFMTEHLIRQIGKLQDKDERSEQQRIDLLLLVQETIDNSHRRRLDERKEEMEQSIKEGIFEQLKVAIPIILNRLAGKPLLPEQDKSFMLMAALLENLRPEQQAFLRDGLDPPQAAVLAEILGEYEKKKASFMVGRQIPGRQQLVMENALPPPTGDKSTTPEGSPNPLGTMFQNVRDRVATGADSESDDEVIRNLERKGTDFMSRLAALSQPTKPTK
jgi:hypothetical protein